MRYKNKYSGAIVRVAAGTIAEQAFIRSANWSLVIPSKPIPTPKRVKSRVEPADVAAPVSEPAEVVQKRPNTPKKAGDKRGSRSR